MDAFKQEIIDDKLKAKCHLCNGNHEVLKNFMGLQKFSKGTIRKSRWVARLFSNMYSVLSVVEMLISFLLVMGLSEISHSSAAHIDSKTLSIIFAGTFAFLKVIIERYWVKPIIEKWGWGLYNRSILRLKEMTISLNTEATLYQETDDYVPQKQTEYSINPEEDLATSLPT